MKLASLVNLKPLKEGSAKAKALAKQYSMSQLQRMLDQRLGPDQEAASNMSGFDPNEFSDSEDFGPSANDLDAAITIKRGGDVPYDVAIGRMTQDEYDEYMSTVKPDRASFEKSSKFDRMNETNKNMKNLKEAYTEMYNMHGSRMPNLDSIADVDKSGWTPDGGGGSIGYMEWEDGTEMTPQEIQDYFEINHELYDDIMQGLNEWYERGPATIDGKEVDVESIEMDGLENMRRWGPDDGGPDAYILRAEFTDGTPLSDEQKERFADEYPEITQEKAQEQMEEGFHMSQRPTYGQDLKLEPEDMDNPDEDLVIIGSGYADIKSNFGERPPMTNGEYAELGQKVVDQLHNGDKEAAMDYIMSKINEDYKPSHRAYDVIDKSNNDEIVAKKLSYDRAMELAHTNPNYKIKATQRLAQEGSCGYGPDGVPGDTPGETKGMNADDRTKGMIKKLIQKEIAKLNENK